jgi:hypothetical protein
MANIHIGTTFNERYKDKQLVLIIEQQTVAKKQ